MDQFDIIDSGDAAGEEARKVAARRMFMYSEKALLAVEEVERKYVLFPELREALAAFDRVYQLALRGRPQGILLSGPPGSSKTSISQYFHKSLPTSRDIIEGYGALLLRLRSNPCAGSIVSMLLRAAHHPFTVVRKERVPTMRDIAFDALKDLGTRIIFLDQSHVLEQTARKTRKSQKSVVETTASEVLCDLMDQTGIALVFLASDTFGGLERVDEALADRVSVRLHLKYFDDGEAWAKFLSDIGTSTKCIDFGILRNSDIAKRTHRAVLGNRRRTKYLLTEAALIALDAAAPAVDLGHFKLAFERYCGGASQVVNPYADA